MPTRCRACGAELAPEDLACDKCGTKVVQARRHPRFEAVERQFSTLKGRLASGLLTEDEYEAALKNLVIRDDEGRPWMIGAETGQWYYHDGQDWVRGEPPGPRAAPTRRGLPWAWMAVRLGGLLIGAAMLLGVFAVPRLLPPPTATAQPTTAAAARVTATLPHSPTPHATHSPRPTNTPAPTPTLQPATATATPTAPPATPTATTAALLLQDDFSDPSGGAQALFGNEWMNFTYIGGEGRLTSTSQGVLPAMYQAPLVADFVAEFDFRAAAPPHGSGYGLIFRSDTPPGDLAWYYHLVVYPADGVVGLDCWRDPDWMVLKTHELPPGLVAPTGTNHVRLEAVGSEFRVFINDTFAFSATDATLTAPGILGLTTYSSVTEANTVYFDNLLVHAAP